jgi:hypothetical protein
MLKTLAEPYCVTVIAGAAYCNSRDPDAFALEQVLRQPVARCRGLDILVAALRRDDLLEPVDLPSIAPAHRRRCSSGIGAGRTARVTRVSRSRCAPQTSKNL